MKRVMVVCSGNICRSPMGAAFAQRYLEAESVPAVVISAGTLNINGRPADGKAVEAMREIGLSIRSHVSQGAAAHLLDMCDYILVMEEHHAEAVLERAPKVGERIVRLWEYVEPAGSLSGIADPVGRDLDFFKQCRDVLDAAIAKWAKRVAILSR